MTTSVVFTAMRAAQKCVVHVVGSALEFTAMRAAQKFQKFQR